MNRPAFFLIVVDHDKNEFTVEGPMFDDQPWNRAVMSAQNQGRNVRCFNGGPSRLEALVEWQQHFRHNLVRPGSIVWPSQSN
jgi:hypothetical protein